VNLTAMDTPGCMSADAVRNAKSDVIRSVRLFNSDNIDTCVVRGQYAAGTVNDHPVLPYSEEQSVSPDSNTETFVALKLMVDNDRWRGVPFYLRTGKSLPRRVSEIAIQFKHSPFKVCHDLPQRVEQNHLIIRIQPDEGIDLHFGAKVPGPVLRVGMVDMNFCYRDYFGVDHSSGYETLIYDCMIGDTTLFARADNLETGWGIVDPVLDHWREQGDKGLRLYAAGTWGPPEADALLQRDGRCWRNLG
jgi:glucose-6-phosphate 1-dehydrogenase